MLITNETDKSLYKNVWVTAELTAGNIQPVTYELIGAARRLADIRGSEVWVLLMGPEVVMLSDSLYAAGADTVISVIDAVLADFQDEIEANVLVRLIEKFKPEIIITGATTRGRALIPRVAVLAECGLTADCTQLDIDRANGDLLQTRPAFGGNILATIRCSNRRPQLATVRPRVMKAPEPDASRSGRQLIEKLQPLDFILRKNILETVHSSDSAINLADARIIISGGRGVGGPEGFKLLQRLADRVGGAVGASRAAVDAGWIPYTHQIGQTGQTVQTKVYIACGISGQIQHLVGMQACDLIIAIDKQKDTPMMQLADIALVGDLFEIIPELINEIPRL
ncbi:MAG: electron transfer flavoprotein subunit alpha/FixB family protein [Ruminococcaceae bacterium]|nr:electron transfer flavoprotein subunit alpha/FixB family protein [Oscillospiraceae bacterium]